MAQEKERLCLTPVINRYYALEEEAKKIKTERDRIKKMLSGVPGFNEDDEPELKDTERIKQLTLENEKLNSELRSAKRELEDVKDENDSLQRRSDRLEKDYAELAKQKYELETKKNQHDEAFWVSVYWGAPFGGLAIAILAGLCRLLGLFEGFFQRFSENAETIALWACGAVVSYVAIRIYYLEKGKNRS